MTTEVRDKRIDTDKDGSRWFRAVVVVLDDDGDVIHRRSVQRALDHFDCDTPCIQRLVNSVKDQATTAAQNAARIDLDAIS